MKQLLTRFKISNAMNGRQPLSKFWQRQVDQSAPLQQFEESARRIDRLLKESSNTTEADIPASLHDSIMRAVKQEQAATSPRVEPSRQQPPPILQWGLVSALAALLIVAGWIGFHPEAGKPPSAPAPLAQLPAVWDFLEQFDTTASSTLTKPLSGEIENISQDLNGAARFLLASVP